METARPPRRVNGKLMAKNAPMINLGQMGRTNPTYSYLIFIPGDFIDDEIKSRSFHNREDIGIDIVMISFPADGQDAKAGKSSKFICCQVFSSSIKFGVSHATMCWCYDNWFSSDCLEYAHLSPLDEYPVFCRRRPAPAGTNVVCRAY